MEASKEAIDQMVDYIAATYQMSPEDVYLLCSLCVDLKITEIVDGNLCVTTMLPLSIFIK